jgi:pimeloyl-ACP methyl ester carboxylesterase
MALTAVAQAMYSADLWPSLQSALVAAEEGDGAPLLELYDMYLQRRDDGTWDDSLEAFQVISCQDMAERATVEEEDALAEKFREVAPRTAPGTSGSYFCTFFPPAVDPQVPITGKGAGPILVMGTTGDPATPLEGTRRMAEALDDGRLVVVTAEGHTGYSPGRCSGDVIEAYLIDPVGKAPADGTECR